MKPIISIMLLILSTTVPIAVFAATSVRVMVLTAYPQELAPWLKHMSHTTQIRVRGAFSPVWCENRGLCVTETGQGLVNASTSVGALLLSRKLDVKHAVFLRAGDAGGPPWGDGTLGSAYWANWVVSWDLGHHLAGMSHGNPEPRFIPLGAAKPPLYTRAFKLNPSLVKMAYDTTKDTPLADDKQAMANRKLYPSQAGRDPNVGIGATVTGDDFWSGAKLSRIAQQIVSYYSDGEARYATSAMEDTGDAGALARYDMLSHYLSLRTVSDFDQPPEDRTAASWLLKHAYPGGDIAVENAYRVGMAFARYVLAHPHETANIIAQDTVIAPHYPLSATKAEGR